MPEDGDDVASYEHTYLTPPGKEPIPIVKQKPNGDCFYLGEGGCTIHDRAPAICRAFDCRRWFLKYSNGERKRMIRSGFATKEIFKAGQRRLWSLEAAE